MCNVIYCEVFQGKSCCILIYWINLFKLRQNTVPVDITKLCISFSANLFYQWNLWWNSVIQDCRKIKISSFNVCFALAVIVWHCRSSGSQRWWLGFSLWEKYSETLRTSTIACSLQKEIKYIFQIWNWIQYRKAVKSAYTCVNESEMISTSQNGCTRLSTCQSKHSGLHSYLNMNLRACSLELFVNGIHMFSCAQLCVFLFRLFIKYFFCYGLVEWFFFNHLLLFLGILGKTTRCWCAIHVTKATILSVYNQLWTLYQQMVGNVK